MAIEKAKSEWRARVEMPKKFEWIKQVWPSRKDKDKPNRRRDYPYNSKGIRAIGGQLKDANKDDPVEEQSIRFSTKKKFKWTSKKIKKWIKKEGYTLKMLLKMYTVNNKPIFKRSEHMVYITSTEGFDIKKAKGNDGKWIITGVASSDQIDKHLEIVAPEAMMNSKEDYMEFPTVRNMHEAEQVGETLDMWREGNKIWVDIEIFDDEAKIWHRIETGKLRALSIGFRMIACDEYCPDGREGQCYLRHTEIMLVEISLVDSPANTDAIFEVKKQLKAIGGDALVNKMIMKVKKNKDETSNIGELEVEENIEKRKRKSETMSEKRKTEEEEETQEETPEETETESEEDAFEAVDEDEGSEEETEEEPENETEEEEEEAFIPAEGGEEETEEKPKEVEEETIDETKVEITQMRADINDLKESVTEIKGAIESLREEKLAKIKKLTEENKELKKKVETKKLSKRKSFKSTTDVHEPEEESDESKLERGRDAAQMQLERLAHKRINKKRR